MGNANSHTPSENHSPHTLKQPFQDLLIETRNPLNKREKRLIFFIIYYLEWLELPAVGNEALHSRYRAYRDEVKALHALSNEKPMGPGQYQRNLEKDVARIKDRLRPGICGDRSATLKICIVLLKAVGESFRFGNMPPRFGERPVEKRIVVVPLEKQENHQMNIQDFRDPKDFDPDFMRKLKTVVVRPQEIYRPRRECTTSSLASNGPVRLQKSPRISADGSNLNLPMSIPPSQDSQERSINKLPPNRDSKLDGMVEEVNPDLPSECSTRHLQLVVKRRLEDLDHKIDIMQEQRKELLKAQNRMRDLERRL